MAFDVEIDSVSKKGVIDLQKKIKILMRDSERWEMTFTTLWSANYKPARFLQAVAYDQDGTTPMFTGVVFRRKTKAVGPNNYATEVKCLNYWYYLDKTEVALSFDAPVTVAAALAELVSQLPAGYSITVDAAQTTGPTLAPFSYTGPATAAAKEIGRRANGWVARLSPANALRIAPPGSTSAPYGLTDASPHCRVVQTEDPDTAPANRAVLWCGPTGNALTTQTWTADGVDTSWVTDIPAAVVPPVVTVDNGVDPPFVATVGSGAMFEFDLVTSTLSVGTYGTPSSGTTLTLGSGEGFLGIFPVKVEAASGATPVLTETRHEPSITEYDAMVEAVTAMLAEVNQEPEALTVESLDHGWRPGQALVVDLTTPPIDTTYNIGPVTITLNTDEHWVYSFSASEATVYQGSKLDLLRRMVSSISSGGAAGASVSATGSGGVVLSTSTQSLINWVGGLRNQATTLSDSEWRDIKNFITIPALASDVTVRVDAETWTRIDGKTFKFRLWNIDDGVSEGESSFVTPGDDPAAPVTAPLTVVKTAGKRHKIQVIGEDADDNGEDAYVVATIVTV